MHNVLASGSLGNCVIYHESIVVDMGVPYSKIEPYIKSLQIVLLSHEHGDHINLSTIKRLAFERPALRFACGDFLVHKIEGIKNIDILEHGKMYDYGQFQISPVVLYHNVKNYGFRIFKDGTKIFHATDTAHLDGISAKGYDLYAIEHNWNEDTAFDIIQKKRELGEFSHIEGAINSHLSEQKARDFIFKNKSEHSKVLRLHESKSN